MKISITINATVPAMLASVVRAWFAVPAEQLRALVQERTPAGITIDSVTVQEEKTP